MLRGLLTPESPYRTLARVPAIIWTIGIFVACLWPGKELPRTDIPFADKWTHFILFGAFAFLWLCAYPSGSIKSLLWMIAVSVALGWLVECLQGWLPALGRTKDTMDAVADGVGGVLGTFLFALGAKAGRGRDRRISA